MASKEPKELSQGKAAAVPCLRPGGGRVLLDIKAQPGASRTAPAGIRGGRLKVTIAAAPEDGKANRELLRFFAKLLGCAKSAIRIEAGEKSPLKTLSFPAERLENLAGMLENYSEAEK